jgi:DNA ligase-associated metallophosphoesterase
MGEQTDYLHTVAGQTLQLMAERCAYWREQNTLLAADLHLGKEGTLQSAGIAVPQGPTTETLGRLTVALQKTGAGRLIVLGDLFHGAGSIEALTDVFSDWRRAHRELAIELTSASHDRWSGTIPAQWRITEQGMVMTAEPFAFTHYPEPLSGFYTLAGHLHPGVALADFPGNKLYLPCFHFTETIGVLPAFGGFTGVAPISRGPGDHCFAIVDIMVIPIPQR